MHAGKWNGLGGKLESGETPEECAVREIAEESGLQVIAPELRGLLTFPAFRPGEDWYAFVFVARQFTGELIDSSEGVLAWIDDARLLDLPLWPGDKIFLPWLEQDRFFSAKFVYVAGELVAHQVSFYPSAAATQPAPRLPAQSSKMQTSPAANRTAGSAPASTASRYTPHDDTYCWVCSGPVLKRHCKIICQACGFTRDCSDP